MSMTCGAGPQRPGDKIFGSGNVCSTAMGKRNKGNDIIPILYLLRQLLGNARNTFSLKRWRYTNLDSEHAEDRQNIPWDVPKGHVPVYVGSERRRFVIPTAYLNHPLFSYLLSKAEEEFGFDHQMGLIIPCEEVAFKYLTSLMAEKDAEHVAAPDLDLDLEWVNVE